MTRPGMFKHTDTEPHDQFVSLADESDDNASERLYRLPIPSSPNTQTMTLRKSHARKQNLHHVPRPRNAFILFRCDLVQQMVPDTILNDHRDLSRLAGHMWRRMTDDQKRPWFNMAEVEKETHSVRFPNYRYTPGPLNRPKRVYTRKKQPASVPQLIELKDPYLVGRRRSTRSSDLTQTVVTQSDSNASSRKYDSITHNPRETQGTHYEPYLKSQRYTLPMRGAFDEEDHRAASPTPNFHAGFLQIPKQEEFLDFTPPHTGPYNSQGFWVDSIHEAPSPTFSYSYSEYSPASTIDTPTPSPGANSLLQGWRDLNTFHDQFQQSPRDLSHSYFSHPHTPHFDAPYPSSSSAVLDAYADLSVKTIDHT